MARDYKKENENYKSKPEQIAKRVARNRARRELMREGLVRKGDGKDVDHIDSNPLNGSRTNLRVRDASANRSFPRTKTAREKKR